VEGICGVFSSEVAAAWLSGLFTAAATIAAVLIYYASRADQQKQSEARRSVLMAMLNDHVRNAADNVEKSLGNIHKGKMSADDPNWRWIAQHMRLKNNERLIELQAMLIEHGHEQDACIAMFIERCRHLDITLQSFQEAGYRAFKSSDSNGAVPDWAAGVMRSEHQKMMTTMSSAGELVSQVRERLKG
jgi:hypothetical protein